MKKVEETLKKLGREKLHSILRQMVLIRHLETRGEFAYQHGYIGGFYHSYTGQEAIQTAAVMAFGKNNWYIDTYRCHALALLLGATPDEIMAELYGKKTGNAKGRGGSMHLYTERLLGGFGIVGGHLPIAAGAAFSIKYLKKKELSICFLGDGAVAQGAFHETLNLVSLWNLPAIIIIENNHWGMGTHVSRALSVSNKIAEAYEKAYNIKTWELDGSDFFNCFSGFEEARDYVLNTSKPVLIECVCDRFRGHSISDPGLYRTKDELAKTMQKDPIVLFRDILTKEKLLTIEEFKTIDQEEKEKVIRAMKFAEESPFPSSTELEEGVYAS